MNTKCQKCIFKKNDEHNIQTGCSVGVLEKLHEYPSYNNNVVKNDGSLIIQNFYCPYARTEQWEKACEDMGLDPYEYVSIDSHQKYHLCIMVRDNNTDNAISMLTNMISVPLLPKKISIIYVGTANENVNKLLKFCQQNIDQLSIQWKIHKIIDQDCTPSEAIDYSLETYINENTNIIMIFDANEYNNDYPWLNMYDIINFHLHKPVVIVSKNMSINNICIPYSLYIEFEKKIGLVLDYLYHTTDQAIIYTI